MTKLAVPTPISGGLLLSYRCNSRCKHCLYACSPSWSADWLSEAACETSLRLLRIFRGMMADGIAPKVTIGISPVLTEQLADDVFKTGLIEYIDLKIDAAHENEKAFMKSGENPL